MSLTEERVKELARACRLSLTPEELATYTADLSALEELSRVLLTVTPDRAATDVRPSRALGEWREDVVEQTADAPLTQNGYIEVPRAVEELL